MIDQKFLQECFEYEAETGDLTWRVRPLNHFKTKRGYNVFNSRNGGEVAGCVNNYGYLKVGLNNKTYLAHRIIWMLVHGEWPLFIDHIDGNTINNRFENLRSVLHIENCKNRKRGSTNKSGVTGIWWCKPLNKWRAQVTRRGVQFHLGFFESFNDAVITRKMAEYELGFHANHGR